jgi:hypothetical protein
LSDHDDQIIFINNTNLQIQNSYTQSVTNCSKSSFNDFLIQLSYEIGDSTFTDQDMDMILTACHNTYLRIFYSNFPKNQIMFKTKSNPWMTCGIKISCWYKQGVGLAHSSHSVFQCTLIGSLVCLWSTVRITFIIFNDILLSPTLFICKPCLVNLKGFMSYISFLLKFSTSLFMHNKLCQSKMLL